MSNGDPQPGDVIDGRYLLEREIGRGGHGVVYASTDQQTGARVALKLLRQNIAEDPQFAVRLEREAQSLQMLCVSPSSSSITIKRARSSW